MYQESLFSNKHNLIKYNYVILLIFTIIEPMKEISSSAKPFHRIGMVARWQPVHLGHLAVLCSMLEKSEQVLIGIGSANTYNFRCPFTLEETKTMLEMVLEPNTHYQIIPVPDLNDGPRWRRMVRSLFEDLDCFITANPYVANLMEKEYTIIHPVELLQPGQKIKINGEMVRKAMAKGENWGELVPPSIQEFIASNKLDIRFRKEFGLETLALDTIIQD